MTPSGEVTKAMLGLLAIGELTSFERIATEARNATTLRDKIALARLAGEEIAHFEQIAALLDARGADLGEVMNPYHDSITAFHERARPRDWPESLMKGYVVDSIIKDIYREVLARLDDEAAAVARTALDDTKQLEFLEQRLGELIEDDPQLAGRLALWGRRLVGEALGRGREIMGSPTLGVKDTVTTEGVHITAEATIAAVLGRVTSAHSRRMSSLGLVA